jgi:SAM-dependent methyltransferase
MTIHYYIDNVQLFKSFLYIEGWAFSGPIQVVPSLRYQGNQIKSELIRKARPDLNAHFPDAPAQGGFELRAIVTGIAAPEDIVVILTTLTEELIIEKPGESALNKAHRPLADVTEKFFERARGATTGSVLEIGARARSGIVRRSQFGEKLEYTGFDIGAGENVDVVGDAHELSRYFSPAAFDFCFSVSVFEHLMWPWKVVLELNAVMKVGGLAFMQSHPAWPKHEMPWDFFRFWDSGWRAMFCDATGFRVLETVEALVVDLVPRQYTGNRNLYWEGDHAMLASAVLTEKIGAPKVAWSTSAPLDEFGKYPF